MVGQQHQLDGDEFEQASEVGDGQGSLACCSPWGCKESDMTEQLNGTDDFECMCACVIDRQSLRERRERVCVCTTCLSISESGHYVCTQSSVQFSCLLVSDSLRPHGLRPHGLQHARLPCPSPTPGACSNSRPSSR